MERGPMQPEKARARQCLGTAVALVGAITLLAGPAVAQQPVEVEDTARVYELEPIEVWYTRIKTPARRVESFSLFTTNDLRRSSHLSPYEFFKGVPGVNLVQGHVIGYGLRNPVAGRIQIRGIGRVAGTDTNVRGVLLLMDGVPDFSITHGHPLPDMFSRSYVDEIEVIKGPSSVRYGWAQAGAILMRSRDPQRMGHSGYFAGAVGSWSTTQNLAEYANRWENGFVQLSGAWRETDGHRPNSATRAIDGRVRFAQRIVSGVNVVGSLRGGTNDWEIPGPVGGEPGVGGENDWLVADVGARGSVADWDIAGKVWGFDADVNFTDGLVEPNRAYGVKTKAEAGAWEGGTLTLGTDVTAYQVGRGNPAADLIPAEWDIAPYVWARHDLGSWVLSGGARFTHNTQFGEDLSPEVGLAYVFAPMSAVRAHVSHGFRAPNPFEYAFGSSRNPDLEATDLWQYELGWRQMFGRIAHLDVSAWVQDGENMIRPVFDPVVMDERNANSGKFTHLGGEAELVLSWANGFWIGAAVAAMDLREQTALVPQTTVDFNTGYDHPRVRLGLTGRHARDLHQRDNSEVPLDDYTVLDLTALFRATSQAGLRLELRNLFDEDYETFNNWPMPGFGAFVGIEYVL